MKVAKFLLVPACILVAVSLMVSRGGKEPDLTNHESDFASAPRVSGRSASQLKLVDGAEDPRMGPPDEVFS